VKRFTYWQLVKEPEWVMERIEKALASRRNELFQDRAR
jgi:hypothetical protein